MQNIIGITEAYTKTRRTISSCQTLPQLDVAMRMVEGFERLFKSLQTLQGKRKRWDVSGAVQLQSLSDSLRITYHARRIILLG